MCLDIHFMLSLLETLTLNLISNIKVVEPRLSDNKFGKKTKIIMQLYSIPLLNKPQPIRKSVTYRNLNSIDINSFSSDIESSTILLDHLEHTDLEQLVDVYTNVFSTLLKKHAPIQTKTIV